VRTGLGIFTQYPALLGALLEAYFPALGVDLLRNSLHPLTKYKLEGIENILPNKVK
jgi:hypothetical protein